LADRLNDGRRKESPPEKMAGKELTILNGPGFGEKASGRTAMPEEWVRDEGSGN